jgi:hypothetical protein
MTKVLQLCAKLRIKVLLHLPVLGPVLGLVLGFGPVLRSALVLAVILGLTAPSAQASVHYQLSVAFSSYAVLDRAASSACQDLGFSTKSSSIVHFLETSVRVATKRQIRTRIPLTSAIYFLQYEGTSSCKVYVPLK